MQSADAVGITYVHEMNWLGDMCGTDGVQSSLNQSGMVWHCNLYQV